MKVRRGDIVIVDLSPTRGSEQQGKSRPCVVIQNDTGNKHSPTTIIAPFTTSYSPNNIYPFEVEVRAANTPLNQDSVADLSQIRVVDIGKRISKNIGSIPTVKIAEIDTAIEDSLGL
ncbi:MULTISPECIES: type II toxin-antitoxin system PemK/MazF family toxin [unclassified Haloparvum]|uniref:type II toxin-antitoxin system PemK/MazF family toxin n=1 Tax=Haloparvum sp. PAK95 TaxID=3418962 RepID=UPI003D2F3FDA